MTNRELYLFVTSFEAKQNIPTLENYLKSLWAIASPSSFTEPTIKNLNNWLETALTYSPPEFNNELFYEKFDLERQGFGSWENRILLQIVDLQEMDKSGQLKDPMRYFGINISESSRWYNFDVLGYLERAIAGMYGDGEDDSDILEIEEFSWNDFAQLLWYGQNYE